MTLDEVYNRIFIGNIEDSQKFQGVICCVLEGSSIELANTKALKTSHKFPIFDPVAAQMDMAMLEQLTQFVNRVLKGKESNILIHCAAGMERSPLATAYVLFRLFPDEFYHFEDAYKHVKEKHPDTRFRYGWMPDWIRRFY